ASHDIIFHLQPLKRIHLYSSIDYGVESRGNIKTVFIYSAIAFFILLIGCINFVNLTIGMCGKRFTEIGLRKVMGANKAQIVTQFWGEVIITCFLAVLSGIVLAEIFFPAFNSIVNRNIPLEYTPQTILTISGLLILACFLGGAFPSFVFAQFKSVEILRGRMKIGGSNNFTKSLVVLQFVLSIFFILCTTLVSDQLDFIMKSYKKFENRKLVGIDLFPLRSTIPDNNKKANSIHVFQEEVLKHHAVVNSSYASAQSGFRGGVSGVPIEINGEKKFYVTNQIDYGYVETFELELLEGRSFSKDITSDAKEAVIINESMKKEFGWDSAVGKKIKIFNEYYTVIGVMKDFVNTLIYYPLRPEMYLLESSRASNVFFKIDQNDIQGTVAFIKEKWEEIFPNTPFAYSFMEDGIRSAYSSEFRSRKMFGIVSSIAIILSCFGILGLTALTVTRRTKEIGIRKVFGAKVRNILSMLVKEFVLLVFLAGILASPAAYYFMNKWLQNFAYHTNIRIFTFIISISSALGIALIVLSFQSIKAATANPVESLRHE
ncbi:ABC transporter permease, partial [candidate division KSB1 bacterium]